MKKIKIKICEFGRDNEFLKNHYIYQILEKFYDVELTDQPDYVFYNESTYDYLEYDAIRIFYTGENITPNFNLCDYAFGFDYMSFGDRYYRYPLYLSLRRCKEDWASDLGVTTDITKNELFSKEDLKKKKEFCSFIYSNYRADENRKKIFTVLNSYKKVNAAGAYLNNTGGIKVKNKLNYESQHKFSIAFENSSRVGYTTEKLISALAAKTIPIYWGNPEIAKEFNELRFINCHAYSTFEEVLTKIKEIDTNDEAYLNIINQPATIPNYNFNKIEEGFEDFLKNIFDQPLEKAFRRTINRARALGMEKNERLVAKIVARKNIVRKILAVLYQPFKHSAFFEKLKHSYFSKKN